MRHALLVALPVALLSIPLSACGDSSPSGGRDAPTAGAGAAASLPPATDADAAAVKAQAVAFFDAVKAGGGARAAALLAYKGPDESRRYQSPARYDGDEQRQVDRVVQRVAAHLEAGAPTFEKNEARTKGAERWVTWTLRFGAGNKPKRALYAFVLAGGTWLLGDIDDLR